MADLDAVQPEPIGANPTKSALAESAVLAKSGEAYQKVIVRSVNQNIILRWIGLVTAVVALFLLVILEAYLLCHIMWHYGHAEMLTQLAFAPIVAFTTIVAVFLFGVYRSPRASDFEEFPAGRMATLMQGGTGS